MQLSDEQKESTNCLFSPPKLIYDILTFAQNDDNLTCALKCCQFVQILGLISFKSTEC